MKTGILEECMRDQREAAERELCETLLSDGGWTEVMGRGFAFEAEQERRWRRLKWVGVCSVVLVTVAFSGLYWMAGGS